MCTETNSTRLVKYCENNKLYEIVQRKYICQVDGESKDFLVRREDH